MLCAPFLLVANLSSLTTSRHQRTDTGDIILKLESPIRHLLHPGRLLLQAGACLLCLHLTEVDGVVVEGCRHLPGLRLVVRTAQHLGDHPSPCHKVGQQIIWSANEKTQSGDGRRGPPPHTLYPAPPPLPTKVLEDEVKVRRSRCC